MTSLLSTFFTQIYAASPFFILVGLGYYLAKVRHWPTTFARDLTRFLFNIGFPLMLFNIMAQFYKQPAVDARLLLAYFGGSFIVYLLARLYSQGLLKLTASEASVFGIGGIFSNNVMLGMPIVMLFLGKEALPVAAFIITLDALLLWSLVSISIEWAQSGSFSLKGFYITFTRVIRNPVVMGVLLGLLVSLFKKPIPSFAQNTLDIITDMTPPLALFLLGLGLGEHKVFARLHISSSMCLFKLFIHPWVIFACAILLKLPPLETKAITILGSMAMGMNVYLMARYFEVIEGPTASSLVLTTFLSSITTPFLLLFIM